MKIHTENTVNFLKSVLSQDPPEIGIVLGSGLGGLTDRIQEKQEIPYGDIPDFPVSTVQGHEGKLVVGSLSGKRILAMKGRFHYYEGYDMKKVTYPVYVMKGLGIRTLVVTNAAGGVNPFFRPGDFMILSDHINNMGTNPLIGENDEAMGPRFPDMSEPYSRELIQIAKMEGIRLGIPCREGVYMANSGPTYETRAEVKFARTIGADAVGMSTVPEVIVANYLGMKVLGISCITNMATGVSAIRHSHEEIIRIAQQAGEKFCDWMEKILEAISA